MSVILIILNRSWDQISPNSVVIETEVFLNVLENETIVEIFWYDSHQWCGSCFVLCRRKLHYPHPQVTCSLVEVCHLLFHSAMASPPVQVKIFVVILGLIRHILEFLRHLFKEAISQYNSYNYLQRQKWMVLVRHLQLLLHLGPHCCQMFLPASSPVQACYLEWRLLQHLLSSRGWHTGAEDMVSA